MIDNPDADVRLRAVENLMGKADTETLELMQAMLDREQDEQVLESIRQVIAFTDLDSSDPEVLLGAIQQLDGHLNQQVLLIR